MTDRERKQESATDTTKPDGELQLDKETLADLSVDEARERGVKGGGCSGEDTGCGIRTR